MNKNIHFYDDIIDLPHPVSKSHPQMSQRDRAAQFAPFAALTGHKEAVHETARLTEEKRILDDNKKAILDEHLQAILQRISERPVLRVTYFVPDAMKEGGSYLTECKAIRRIDEVDRVLQFLDGSRIYIDDIYEIELPDETQLL